MNAREYECVVQYFMVNFMNEFRFRSSWPPPRLFDLHDIVVYLFITIIFFRSKLYKYFLYINE